MDLLRLNIGAGMGAERVPNQINSDLYPGENVDVVFNACQGWPFKDNSISFIQANHVLEHLPDPWAFFREAWRVLTTSPAYNMELRLPYGVSDNGLSDLSHVRLWLPGSFCCFQPGYDESVRNPQFNQWSNPLVVVNIGLRINYALRWLCKPIIRYFGVELLQYIWGGFVEMIVRMRPIKNKDDEIRWLIRNQPNSVPVARFMYQHEYEGRGLKKNEPFRMKFF